MKRKWLIAPIFLLISIVLVFYGNFNMVRNIDVETSYELEEHMTNESITDEIQKDTKIQDEEKPKEKIDEIITQEDQIGTSLSNNSIDEKMESIFECTLSVKCDTVLNNMSNLDKEKVNILPADGIIFPEKKVVFYDGESVFNVLLREMKKNKIHLDFENTQMYRTVYIKGISNLYEYDCGELSGWLYIVNGKIPNYGCSQYTVKSGDKIEFVYTCDLGKDIGL